MLEKNNQKIPDFLLKSEYRVFRHLLVQFIVLFITMNILWDEPDRILPGRFAAWFTYYIQINMVIYMNMWVLVPRLLLKGKTTYYILSLPFVILAAVFSMGLIQSLYSLDTPENKSMILESMASLAGFMALIIGVTTIQLFKYRLGNQRRINELQSTTMEIELANLQNQINPHFLFNMLNNANIMARENAVRSSYILSKLKDLLKYQVEEGSKETIRLKDDINFLRDYLELEKMRRDRFSFTLDTEGNMDREIPPLLFIPFVENAVKHNPENDSYVYIQFRITDNKLYFICKNTKARLAHTKKEGGIGLVNIKKRLELLFERNYRLHLNDEKETYTVTMEISL